MNTRKRTSSLSTIVVVATLALTISTNAAIITTPTLDTLNDLLDVGGGTIFASDINGLTTASGGGPWAVNAGDNLSDNNVDTHANSKFNIAPIVAPALVGVHSMPTAVTLAGFAITTDDSTFPWWMPNSFNIQGSNDSTNGYGGTWTDIFIYSGVNLEEDMTYRWNAADDTFLSGGTFTSFRLAEFDGNYDYAEIEFFGGSASAPVPEPSTFCLAALGLLGLYFGARRRRGRA